MEACIAQEFSRNDKTIASEGRCETENFSPALSSVVGRQEFGYISTLYESYIRRRARNTIFNEYAMKNFALLTAAALLPSLSLAHYHFPHLVLNGRISGAHEYVRPTDNGYMPSWEEGAFLNNPDIRCNKGSMNHRTEPKTAKIIAGKDIVGFQTNVQARIQHPGPLTVRDEKTSWPCSFGLTLRMQMVTGLTKD
jgi:hypothetical protein